MFTTRIAIALSASLAIVAVACSSPDVPSRQPDPKGDTKPTDPDKTGGGTRTPSGGTTPGGGETPPGGGTDPKPTNDGAACLAKPDADGCFTCCEEIDPAALEAAEKAADTCLCDAASGPCKTQCGTTLCQNKEPSDACYTCMDSQPAAKCGAAFKTACDASAGCKAFVECSKKCADKFPEQGGQGDN
jgi:hypothetical protein